MTQDTSKLDRGHIIIDGFPLNSRSCIKFPGFSDYQLQFEIPDSIIPRIQELAENVYLVIECDATRFNTEEEISIVNIINRGNKYRGTINGSIVHPEIKFSLQGFDNSNTLILRSNIYTVELERSEVDIEFNWISFKDHDLYKHKSRLFWVIKNEFDKIAVYFNEDIRNFKKFVLDKHPKLSPYKRYFFSHFGNCLKAVQRFSIWRNFLHANEKNIDEVLSTIPDNNLFFKKSMITEESTKNERIEAIFPFLRTSQDQTKKIDSWLWISEYYQKDILNIVKEFVNKLEEI